MWSLCDNSNPNAVMLEKMYGDSSAGLFGYSHLFGGYAGGQAEYVRFPFADVGPVKIPDSIDDERFKRARYSSPISSPPDMRPPKTAESSRAPSSLFGDAGRLGSSPLRALICWAPSA